MDWLELLKMGDGLGLDWPLLKVQHWINFKYFAFKIFCVNINERKRHSIIYSIIVLWIQILADKF